MNGRVLVRQTTWLATPAWEVLCPCCADRKPGLAVLNAFESWRQAVHFATAHRRVHR